ncbi:MAG: hypothetical protein ACYS8Z_19285, partial [Planctomycetota bacterium]
CADGRSLLGAGSATNLPWGALQIDVKTSEVTTITRGPAFAPESAPDDKAIFYVRNVRDGGRIVRYDPATGEDKELYSAPGVISKPALSPDGREFAFFESGALKVLPATGGEPRKLAEVEDISTIAWTRDGRCLLYGAASGDKTTQLWRIATEGGEPRKLDLAMHGLGHLRFHPDGRRITFRANPQGEKSEVWVMENFLPEALVAKADRRIGIRQVWSGTFVSNLLGEPSPDGRYLSCVDWETGDLAVYEIATGKKRRLTNKGSWDESDESADASRWSPDSTQIAYCWDREDEGGPVELRVIGLDSSKPRILYSTNEKTRWIEPCAWFPDGKGILAHLTGIDGTDQIVRISATDGSLRVLKTVGKDCLSSVRLSPDGQYTVYDLARQGDDGSLHRDIWLSSTDGNLEKALVEHPADDKLLGWTPDGRHVFFASNRTGTWDAWLLQVAGGKPQGFPQLVKHGVGEIAPIGFTQSGSYYYGHEQTLRDVVVARLDLETGKVLSEPAPVRQTGATTCGDWSPDGRYMAYCTQGPDKTWTIHIRALATGQERILTEALPYVRWLRWSLDGRSLLIDGARKGDSQGVVFKIDVRTGERTDLVRSKTEVLLRPELSPDGKTLFYNRCDPGYRNVRLMARNMEGGREKELFRVVPPARLANCSLSPDGELFALSMTASLNQPSAPVLMVLPAEGGEPRELIRFEKDMRPVGVTWMPDSRNVLFWKWFGQRRKGELWRISAEGGEPQKLWVHDVGHLRVHRDGERMAFNSRSTTSAIWAMEGFLPIAGAGN